jgi:hypothetical protein
MRSTGYLAREETDDGTEERAVPEAMLTARFSLVELKELVPEVGAWAYDKIYDERLFVADVGLGGSAYSGRPGRSFRRDSGTLIRSTWALDRSEATSGIPEGFVPGFGG